MTVQYVTHTLIDNADNRLDLDGIKSSYKKLPAILLTAIQRRTADDEPATVITRIPLDMGGTIAAAFLSATGTTPSQVRMDHLEEASPEYLRSLALALLIRADQAEELPYAPGAQAAIETLEAGQ